MFPFVTLNPANVNAFLLDKRYTFKLLWILTHHFSRLPLNCDNVNGEQLEKRNNSLGDQHARLWELCILRGNSWTYLSLSHGHSAD